MTCDVIDRASEMGVRAKGRFGKKAGFIPAKASKSHETGTNFGGTGVDQGPGINSAAVVFMALMLMMKEYRKIIDSTRDLANTAVTATVDFTNTACDWYQKEVNEQVAQLGVQAGQSFGNALISGVGAYQMKSSVEMRKLTGDQNALEIDYANKKTMQEQVLGSPVSENAAVGTREGMANVTNLNVTNEGIETANRLEVGDTTGAFRVGSVDGANGTKNAGLVNAKTVARQSVDNDDHQYHYDKWKDQINEECNRASVDVTSKTQQINSLTMRYQMMQQVGSNLITGFGTFFQAMVKAGAMFMPGEGETKNKNTKFTLYSNLAMKVLDDQKQAMNSRIKMQQELMQLYQQLNRSQSA